MTFQKRNRRGKLMLACALWVLLAPAVRAYESALTTNSQPCDALRNTVILIIRHAEKPEEGAVLAPAGYARARAYVDYFGHLQIAGQPLKLDHLFCTADSKGSQRPRLTITPLSQALQLPIDNQFKNKDVAELARAIRARSHGREILICWHHGEIPELLRGLAADPEKILPHGKWPDDVFGWMIELCYDSTGRLHETHLVHENLMPDDKAILNNHE